MPTSAERDSNLRRLQRFLAGYALNLDLIAKVIFALLSVKTGLVLSLDRTNWKFGEVNINNLMLGVTHKGVAFPLLFTMLDKRGNSNWQERTRLIDRFIRLFGAECIDSLVADRVLNGGHDVPIPKIISRYDKSIANCIALAPYVDRLYVYDNSIEDAEARLLFRLSEGELVKRYVEELPDWASTILPR